MYTLLELESKTFGELKKIGYELNVLPAGDRRCRQSWIDALVGVNPPLLQLLEDSPAASVEQVQEVIEVQAQEAPIESKFGRIVYPRPAQNLLDRVVENIPAVEVDRAQEPVMETVEASPNVEVELIEAQLQEPLLESSPESCDCPFCGAQHGLFVDKDHLDRRVIRCLHCSYSRFKNYPGAIRSLAQEAVLDRTVYSKQVAKPILKTVETSPGVEVDPVEESIVPTAKTSAAKVSSSKKVKASSYLDCPSCGIGRLRVKQSIYWETSCAKCDHFAESLLYPFTPADTGYKVGDWVKVRIKPRLATNIRRGDVVCIDKVQDDYLRFVNPNLNPALVIWARRQLLHPHEVLPCEPPVVKAAETSPGVKTEVTVSESAIAPATKNHLKEESDRNPILTGLALSADFLARYSPPQSKNIHHKADIDGQLSLLEFDVESVDEPPDPDDFESLDAFREAIARWDREHPSSFDHCSDLPNSVHSEPLEVSLDSFCEWAPCPADWYEPVEVLEASKVMELSPVHKNSSTSDFFIPTFNGLGDRFNRSDEPPDTGIFARLPKPKPPTFPPQSASWTQVGRKLDTKPKSAQVSPSQPQVNPKSTPSQPQVNQASRNYPETIPKLFHRIAAGSSTQPARSPPGGDAMS